MGMVLSTYAKHSDTPQLKLSYAVESNELEWFRSYLGVNR